jgi:hypothetical protein
VAAISRAMTSPDQFARREKIVNKLGRRASSSFGPPTLIMSRVTQNERIEVSFTIWVSMAT